MAGPYFCAGCRSRTRQHLGHFAGSRPRLLDSLADMDRMPCGHGGGGPRRLLSLRMFDADAMMIDADVVDLHFARPGCFAARVTRAVTKP